MITGRIKISRFNEGLIVFKPDYYLNEGKKVISDLIEKGIKSEKLSSISDKIYQGGIFKRVFVKNEEKSHKYMTASDIQKETPLATSKNISKKYTPWVEEMTLKNNQILVSCAGTGSCGKTALVNDSYSGNIGSQEIIRVETSKIPFGFIYAYISAPLIYQYIQSMTYGAAIPRISPEELGKLPVLLPSKSTQEKIHNLVKEASELRVEAHRMLSEAHEIYYSYIQSNVVNTDNRIKYSYILSKGRLNAHFFLSKGEFLENQVLLKEHYFIRDLTSRIFTSGREKRDYVNNIQNGKYFFSNTDLANSNPYKSASIIRRSKAKKESEIRSNYLLTGRVGAVGEVTYPFKHLISHLASDNVIRMSFINEDKMKLSYAFLSSSIGKEIIFKRKSGTNQPFITEDMLLDIPIPKLKNIDESKVVDKISTYADKIEHAIKNENQAIDLVEKEIESWQE